MHSSTMGSNKGENRVTVRPQIVAPILPFTRYGEFSGFPEMAVQTWTLWQRMPPRYQLTTRCFDDEDDDMMVVGSNSGSASVERPSHQSFHNLPRPFSGRKSNQISARPQNTSTSLRENFMLSNNALDITQQELSHALKKKTSKCFSFPKRNSDYVNTYQMQRRVNSARRRLAEVPPTPNFAQAQSDENTSPRAHTAPVFPVTNPETHNKDKQPMKLIDPPSVDLKTAKINVKPKLIGEPSKVDIFHFDDAKSVSNVSSSSHDRKQREKENKPKKYVVQDTSRATVYIDNGKVMYFGKSRHDLTQLLKTQSLRADRNSCFLAEIRRDYLKHPKYERGRSSMSRRTETDPRRIANERVDYNRRVEHILNYYDENGEIIPSSQSRPTSGYRSKSPKGSRMKGLSLTPAAPSRPPSRTASPANCDVTIDGSNDFIRLNKQLKLHERQFYLRTPGDKHGSTLAELEKCRCSMCRMELQLALVTGVAHIGSPRGHDGNVTMTSLGSKEHSVECKLHNSNDKPGTATKSRSFSSVRSSAHKVSFINPEVDLVAQAQEPGKYTISCTLPDVDRSESGFESARTHDVVSTCPGDLDQ